MGHSHLFAPLFSAALFLSLIALLLLSQTKIKKPCKTRGLADLASSFAHELPRGFSPRSRVQLALPGASRAHSAVLRLTPYLQHVLSPTS